MPLVAKFAGTCKRCRGPISVGEKIVGERGKGYTHETCQPANPQQPLQFVMPQGNGRLATKPQQELIESLLDERDQIPELVAMHIPADLGLLASNQAGTIIDALFNIPKGPQADVPGPDKVPAGRYALEDGPALQLVRVWRGGDDPNVVRVYDDDDPNRQYNAPAILRRIVKVGPADAATRYGQLRGRCWRCGRKLEDKISVELSMGPVCGPRIYDPLIWKMKLQAARDTIRERGEDPNAPAEHSVAA